MTTLLQQLLTSMVGVIAEYHKGTITTEDEFYSQLVPAMIAVQEEITRDRDIMRKVK